MKCALCTAGVVAAAAVLTAAQQPPTAQKPPSFQSGTQVVQVDVRAFKDGHFVDDLKPDDFVIKEDGVEQPIRNLTLVRPGFTGVQAVTYAAAGVPQPDGIREAPIASSVWVFVFDTAHLSIPGLHNTQKSVVDFLQGRFHQGDIGGVVANGVMAGNRLTTVREELIGAVDKVKIGDLTAIEAKRELQQWPRVTADNDEAWEIDGDKSDTNQVLDNAVKRACDERPGECSSAANGGAGKGDTIGGSLSEMVRQQIQAKASNYVATVQASAKQSLHVIEALTNGLARVPGQKTVVYLTEGFTTHDNEELLKEADGMANRAGAHLYVIDARGLNKGAGSSDIINQESAHLDRMPTSHYDLQDDAMNSLAVDTGGIFFHNENNFGRALAEVQDDAGTYYVLGYTPTNQKFDGKYRAISVEVKRPGVKVRARRGYLALEPAKLLKPVPIRNAKGTVVADARPNLTTRDGF
ncbi:MAG TPA: VWA domain-containing protein, partial [Vicinamibacterales bacterium]|nr:VWA domain-containing protein [Vicinamibacterales bacterium]